jgi:hypothetical protein
MILEYVRCLLHEESNDKSEIIKVAKCKQHSNLNSIQNTHSL